MEIVRVFRIGLSYNNKIMVWDDSLQNVKKILLKQSKDFIQKKRLKEDIYQVHIFLEIQLIYYMTLLRKNLWTESEKYDATV